ncbi:MAG: hypothetical protein ABR499_19800 [Gemmatimonadaceae bacterium]
MFRLRLAARTALPVLGAALIVSCDAIRQIVEPPPTQPPPLAASLRFHAGELRVGNPKREHVRNLNASVAVTESRWDYFYRNLAPSLDLWAADARLNINPNLIAAILVAESRMDSLLVSLNPDHGIAQLTQHSDAFILDRAPRPSFGMEWIAEEARTWPRHPTVHRVEATREEVLALMANGEVTAESEYFFRPVQALRGLLFDLRLIEATWTTDGVTWGQFGSWARERLNGGAPLTESQILDLVVVSYNQGYPLVRDLVEQYGPAWTSNLEAHTEEGAFYLPEVRRFMSIFQGAAEAAR